MGKMTKFNEKRASSNDIWPFKLSDRAAVIIFTEHPGCPGVLSRLERRGELKLGGT